LLSLDTAGCVCPPTAEMVSRFGLHDAVEVSADGDVEAILEAEELLTVLGEPLRARTLYDWEGDSSRTLADVLRLCDRAIARATALALQGGHRGLA
jgi:hypothetical protein